MKVGEIEGKEVIFDGTTRKFYVTIDDKRFEATSYKGLERIVKRYREVKWEKAIYLRSWNVTYPPEIVKVVRRGARFYIVKPNGRFKPIRSWYLFEYNEGLFKRLEALSNEARRIEEEFREVESRLKRLS